MARNPAISFRGALKIFGADTPSWVKALDLVLGGFILTAGGLPTTNPLSAVWGWVDQKNEAMRLLREGVDTVTSKLADKRGLERHELVIAAHTIIVATAFFDAVRSVLDVRLKGTLDLKEPAHALLHHIYTGPVPTPSATKNFDQVVKAVEGWANVAVLHGVETTFGAFKEEDRRRVVLETGERYRHLYQQLKVKVPEFAVWADQMEHRYTHTALGRLETLLQPGPPARGAATTVATINRSELARPVVDSHGYGGGLTFPTVDEIFISPRYEQGHETGTDLELVLARHFTSFEATERPLVVLGHPGAGKSLLTKVLAARLSERGYTVVRVPLRAVEADASISEQIREALVQSSNGRVSWAELSDQSEDSVRVVLLDGLDELIQASTHSRLSYLHDVIEFQRVEAVLDRPIAVVVTSRTVVADRVLLPDGCPVLKIKDFDDSQIEEWLSRWNRVNTNDSTRQIPLDIALAQRDIAGQPLLLMMLALYFSDPDVELRTDLSKAELYKQLLEAYAEREVARPDQPNVTETVPDLLRRLAIAALGMFNRGSQNISEAELAADLTHLEELVTSGEHVLGQFFFVHTATATTSAKQQRSYEFLHATFAEYLVASQLYDTVAEIAVITALRGKTKPDDDLLFALLSHQPLSRRSPITSFLAHKFRVDPNGSNLVGAVDSLIRGFPTRAEPRRYIAYQSLQRNHIRTLAAYSANLFVLRLAIADGRPVELASVWPDDSQEHWNSCVSLWKAGLDQPQFQELVNSLSIDNGHLRWNQRPLGRDLDVGVHTYLLADQNEAAQLLAIGHAAVGLSQADEVLSNLNIAHRLFAVLRAVPINNWPAITIELLEEAAEYNSRPAEEVWNLLRNKTGTFPHGLAGLLAAWAVGREEQLPPIAVAAAAYRLPEVFDVIEPLAEHLPAQGKPLFELARHKHGRIDDIEPMEGAAVHLLIAAMIEWSWSEAGRRHYPPTTLGGTAPQW
ncbi:NACHT domain-containing protein [Lentzea sp. NPDC102401]|uniref:NACHT domain-containing protein n=1 Tax=Lentzea sp. NPDC102401 TaxID=3364128 RepID=UPI0038056FE8